MKVWFILTLFISGSALAENQCQRNASRICEASIKDFHGSFYEVERQAFLEALDDSKMKKLVTKHFYIENRTLQASFSFNRTYWFFSGYKKILNSKNVRRCDDFKQFGADENFLLNCEELVSEEMASEVSSTASYRLKNLIEYVKIAMLSSFDDPVEREIVNRALDLVLSENSVYRNLSELKAELVSPKEVCRNHYERTLCRIYGESNKKTLSVGGHVFLSDKVLEAVVIKALAKHVGKYLHRELYRGRALAYFLFLTEKLDRTEFEELIARNVSEDPINASTNTYLVMRKYFAYIKDQSSNFDFFKEKAGYYCYADLAQRSSASFYMQRDYYYQLEFEQLHPFDKMAVLSCRTLEPEIRDYFYRASREVEEPGFDST